MINLLKHLNARTEWWTFSVLAIIPQFAFAVSHAIYIHSGKFFYISFACLGMTLILVALSVASFLCKLVILSAEKCWGKFYAGFSAYAITAIVPYILFKASVHFFLYLLR